VNCHWTQQGLPTKAVTVKCPVINHIQLKTVIKKTGSDIWMEKQRLPPGLIKTRDYFKNLTSVSEA
jgi:hypothetical protein